MQNFRDPVWMKEMQAASARKNRKSVLRSKLERDGLMNHSDLDKIARSDMRSMIKDLRVIKIKNEIGKRAYRLSTNEEKIEMRKVLRNERN